MSGWGRCERRRRSWRVAQSAPAHIHAKRVTHKDIRRAVVPVRAPQCQVTLRASPAVRAIVHGVALHELRAATEARLLTVGEGAYVLGPG